MMRRLPNTVYPVRSGCFDFGKQALQSRSVAMRFTAKDGVSNSDFYSTDGTSTIELKIIRLIGD